MTTTPTREPWRYNQWGSNSKGIPENPAHCIKAVRERDGWHSYQCSRPRGYGEDGLYCKQHVPETVKARREAASLASKARWDQAWYICRKPEHAAFDALLAAAEQMLKMLNDNLPYLEQGEPWRAESFASSQTLQQFIDAIAKTKGTSKGQP